MSTDTVKNEFKYVYGLMADACDSVQVIAIYSSDKLAEEALNTLSYKGNKYIECFELDTRDLTAWQ